MSPCVEEKHLPHDHADHKGPNAKSTSMQSPLELALTAKTGHGAMEEQGGQIQEEEVIETREYECGYCGRLFASESFAASHAELCSAAHHNHAKEDTKRLDGEDEGERALGTGVPKAQHPLSTEEEEPNVTASAFRDENVLTPSEERHSEHKSRHEYSEHSGLGGGSQNVGQVERSDTDQLRQPTFGIAGSVLEPIGSKVSVTLECTHCAQPLLTTAKFCSSCGKPNSHVNQDPHHQPGLEARGSLPTASVNHSSPEHVSTGSNIAHGDGRSLHMDSASTAAFLPAWFKQESLLETLRQDLPPQWCFLLFLSGHTCALSTVPAVLA